MLLLVIVDMIRDYAVMLLHFAILLLLLILLLICFDDWWYDYFLFWDTLDRCYFNIVISLSSCLFWLCFIVWILINSSIEFILDSFFLSYVYLFAISFVYFISLLFWWRVDSYDGLVNIDYGCIMEGLWWWYYDLFIFY